MIAQPIQTLHNVRRYNYTKTGWQLKKEGTLHIVHVIMKTQKEKKFWELLLPQKAVRVISFQ